MTKVPSSLRIMSSLKFTTRFASFPPRRMNNRLYFFWISFPFMALKELSRDSFALRVVYTTVMALLNC